MDGPRLGSGLGEIRPCKDRLPITHTVRARKIKRIRNVPSCTIVTISRVANGINPIDFLGLHDERFEELAFLIAQAEVPGMVRPTNPDGGLDGVVLGNPAPRGIQAKHFKTRIRWDQCVSSLEDAIENYNVQHVTFCFPQDLTRSRIATFNERLVEPFKDVKVDYWGASQLTAKLLASEEGLRYARHIFGDDRTAELKRVILAGQELEDSGKLIRVLLAGASQLNDDPYYRYSATTRPKGLPSPETNPHPTIHYEEEDEEHIVSIDAFATEAAIAAGQMVRGTLTLNGEDNMRRFQDMLRQGGQFVAEDVGLSMQNIPKHLEGLIDKESRGQISIRSPLKILSVALEIVGVHVSPRWEFDLTPTGEIMTFRGVSGACTLTLRFSEQTVQFKADWSLKSASAREQLRYLEFTEALAASGEVKVVTADAGLVLLSGEVNVDPLDDNSRTVKKTLEGIVKIESFLGLEIVLPDQFDAGDINLIQRLTELIDGFEETWNWARFEVRPDAGDNFERGGDLRVREAVTAELMGVSYDLGQLELFFDGYKVDEKRELTDGAIEYVLKPDGPESRLRKRLLPASDGQSAN